MKESQKKAQAAYDKAHTQQVMLKLNKVTDADILEKLHQTANRQGYIKELIRRDIRSETEVLSSEAIRLLVLPVAVQFGFDKVYLIGSYARGEADVHSDVDLLVSGGRMETLEAYQKALEALTDRLQKPVDLVMERAVLEDGTRGGKRFREHIDRDKVLIYEKTA